MLLRFNNQGSWKWVKGVSDEVKNYIRTYIILYDYVAPGDIQLQGIEEE